MSKLSLDTQNFLKELLGRFQLKTPVYFKKWKMIGLVLVASGLAPKLDELIDGITIPHYPILETILKTVGLTIMFMSKQAAVNTLATTEVSNKLPFTKAKVESGVQQSPKETQKELLKK